MSVSEQSPSFESSIASSRLDTFENSMETMNARQDVKEMLKSKIFLGRYLERRLINKHIGYRDVVVVSPAEIELKKVLLEARQKLLYVYPKTHWIGISDSETLGYSSGVSLLTEIDNEPFGPCWFQIRSVKFRDSEILVLLKCLRHITDSYLEVEPILTGGPEKLRLSVLNTPAVIESHLKYTYSEVAENIKNALTLNNLTEIATFIVAFVIALFTGSTTFINFLGNFIIALIRELSVLIKNSTPMFLGVLDFMSKIVGGFYILMAMVFKPNNSHRPQRGRSITYEPQHDYDYRNTF